MIIVAAVLLLFGSSLLNSKQAPLYNQLRTGWSVQRGDKLENDVTLDTYSLGKTKKGEVITITNIIPKRDVISPSIIFKSSLSSVDVRIDGKNVYSFGTEYSDKGKFVPKKYNLITVDDGSVPHLLEISFTVADNNGMSGFYPVRFGTRRDIIRDFLQNNRLSIFVGAFFFIYSLLLISLGLFLIIYKRNVVSVFLSSWLSMILGIYTYSYDDIFCFVSDNDYFFSCMEYFSLYLLPLSVTVLLYYTHSEIARKKQQLTIVINIILPVVFWILHFAEVVHINMFVTTIQIVCIFEIIFMLPSLIIGLKDENKKKIESELYSGVDSEVYLLMGFIIIIFFSFLEIIRYNLLNRKIRLGVFQNFANVNFLNLGMLFFVICLFIYYFLNSIEHLNADNVKRKLEGLAYTDALTGLMNRAKCMQYAETLSGSFAVVSFDLDRLKYVNDKYGHLEGDKMIRSFAELLKSSFADANLIGRTGGDEFLAVFENPASDTCDKCIRALEQGISEFNTGNERFKLSASAGYAYSYEAEKGSFLDTFYLADSRMYSVKESHHG